MARLQIDHAQNMFLCLWDGGSGRVRNKIGAEGGLINDEHCKLPVLGPTLIRARCVWRCQSILCGGQNLKPTLSRVWLEDVLLSFTQRWGAVSQGVVGRSIHLLTRFPTLTLMTLRGNVRIQAWWWPVGRHWDKGTGVSGDGILKQLGTARCIPRRCGGKGDFRELSTNTH